MSNIPRNSSLRNVLQNKCQECGCHCDSCVNNNSIHLHQEIESLKQRLADREQQIMSMESQIMSHATQFPNGEMYAVRENLVFWQEKYERLLESYRKLQKVNQGLEDKLLRVADKFENDRIELTQKVSELTEKLTSAQAAIIDLQQQSEQYKNDCNIAIRLLQCKPTQFMSHRLESFPSDIQERVQQYSNFNRKPPEETNGRLNGGKLIRVPIPTFPPTAVIYSLDQSHKSEKETEFETSKPKCANNYVSAAIMAKILQERENERLNPRCSNCDASMGVSFNSSTPNGDQSEFSILVDQQQPYHSSNQYPNRTAFRKQSNETIII